MAGRTMKSAQANFAAKAESYQEYRMRVMMARCTVTGERHH